MKTPILTPKGTLVQGSPFEAQTKNQQGQPLVDRNGQPTQRYFIAVAIPKTDPMFGTEVWNKFEAQARQDWPQLAQQGLLVPPSDPRSRFSWKIMDGDGVDANGKPNNQKPGFAGCWVIKFSSGFPPKCFYAGRYSPHEQINDVNAIKPGYVVRVSGTIEGNGNQQKPGLYCNLSMVELIEADPTKIIVTGPDAASVFGGANAVQPGIGLPGAGMGMQPSPQGLPGALPGALPSGMLPAAGLGAQPLGGLPGAGGLAGGAMMSPGNPMQTQMHLGGQTGGAPTGLGMQPQQPAGVMGTMMGVTPMAVQPHPGILAGPGGAPQPLGALPGLQPQMAAPAGPQLTPAGVASGHTLQALLAAYPVDQLRAAGYVV